MCSFGSTEVIGVSYLSPRLSLPLPLAVAPPYFKELIITLGSLWHSCAQFWLIINLLLANNH